MKHCKLYIKLVLVFFSVALCINSTRSQTNISGIINLYEVAGSVMGPNSLFVPNASNFQVNDTVLIIQMQGAIIDHSQTDTYGNIVDLNNCGNFEFNIIDNISANTIYFRCNLIN